MENIAQKIKALDYSEEMMAILPKFLGTLAAKNPETGEDLVTTSEIVQILSYLKEKGISLRPSQIKVLANGFSYIKKSVEEMEQIGELKMYVDDPTRMTSKDNVNRIIYLRDKNVEYKSPEGKYSKLAYSKRAFEAEYGVIDFAAEKAKKEQASSAPKTPAEATKPKDNVVDMQKASAPKTPENHEPANVRTNTNPMTNNAGPQMQAQTQSANKPEGKKEINPEPAKKTAGNLNETKVDIKIPVLEEPKPEKINISIPESGKNKNDVMKTAQENSKPKDIKPVTPVNPQSANESKGLKANNKEEKVTAVVTKDESIEYTGELDLASLEASFNDSKQANEDSLVQNTVVNAVEGAINIYNTPYDEILSKPQTIALTDETFERYESLSDSIRRVLIAVYNMAEITDNITDNLIKLITAGVASDSEVMYYSITYGKNISEEEAQHLKASIEEELEYIKIFDLDTEGQGRAA